MRDQTSRFSPDAAAALPARPALARATVYNLFGMLVPLAVQLVTVPLYLKTIGTERYGVMALVWLLLGYFGFCDLGFGRAIASRIAGLAGGSAARRAEMFWTGTMLSVLAGAAGAILFYGLATRLFGNVFAVPPGLRAETAAALPLVALSLPLVTLISALAGALQGCLAFGACNVAQVAGGVLVQVLPLLVARLLSVSLPGLVLAALAGRLVTAGLLLAFCLRAVPGRPHFAGAEILPMLRIGGWVTVTGMVSPLLTMFDRFVIATVAGMAAVTAYTIPYNLVMRLAALPTSLQNALFPRFAMMDGPQADRLQSQSVRLIACAMTPPLIAALLLLKLFLLLWIGQGLAEVAAPIGAILILGLWVNMLAFIPFGFLQSRGKADLPAKFHVGELLAYAPALYGLTRLYGAAGAAWAWDARALADAALLFGAVRGLPALLACWPGLALVAAAFGLAGLGPHIIGNYWQVAGGIFALSLIWAGFSLPAGLKRQIFAAGLPVVRP